MLLPQLELLHPLRRRLRERVAELPQAGHLELGQPRLRERREFIGLFGAGGVAVGAARTPGKEGWPGAPRAVDLVGRREIGEVPGRREIGPKHHGVAGR